MTMSGYWKKGNFSFIDGCIHISDNFLLNIFRCSSSSCFQILKENIYLTTFFVENVLFGTEKTFCKTFPIFLDLTLAKYRLI